MKNLFKKTLACCLVVCMVLTLCISALTVNAENPTGTVVAGTVTVDSGEGTAVIPVEVSAGVAASKVSVKVPAGLTIAGLTLDTADEDVDVTYASAAEPNGKPISLVEVTEFVAPYVDAEGVFSYIIHAPAGEVTTAPVTVEITFAGTFVENAEGILVDVEAEAAPDAVVLFDLTVTDGKIIVKAAHVCEFVGTVTQAPTCTVPGVKTYTCTCGEGTYTEEIPVIPHTEETIPAVPATCTTTGLTAGVKCSVCDTVLTAPTEVPALGHDWGEGEVTTAPDCDDAGVRTYTCANDPSHTKEEAINALGHTPVAYDEVPATCTTVGYTGGTYCSKCDAVIEARTEIPALGHAYGTPVDNGDGTHTATCANDAAHKETAEHEYVDGECICGAVEEVACEHEWDVTASTPAVKVGTEVTPGSISVECKKCGEKSLNNTVGYNAKAGIYNMEAVVKSEVMIQLATKFSGFPAGFVAEDVILVAYTNNTKNGTPDKDCILGTTTRSDGTYEYFDLGVAAYQLSENINITIYVKAADGWVNGKTQNIAFTTYAKTILDTSDDAGVKKVVVDLLNFGSAVQTLNSYNLESLANKEFDSYQSLGSDTSSSPVAESDVNFHQDKSQPMRLASYELIADSRIEFRISLFVKPAVESGAVYVANYTDSNDVEYNVAYVSDESAVETLSGIDFDKVYVLKPYDANATYNKYYVNFAELPVYDSEANVTFTAYANGVAGETLSCSVKGAAAYTRSLKTGDSKSVAAFDALIRYCDSAIAKFR